MTEKIIEAVKWVLRDHRGEPLDKADMTEILQQADKGHRKRFGLPIFADGIDLDGLSFRAIREDQKRVYGWCLSADEKRFISKSHTSVTS